jgi:excinuclease ABC subunit C
VPQRGERVELLALAGRNAAEAWQERGGRATACAALLEELRQRLQLARLPNRIECFDISTLQGAATVGSMAVVVAGEPKPEEYRHYRVRSGGGDDYAALHEVIRRRLQRGVAEGNLPDLLMIDGGLGQLGVLTALLDEFGLHGTIDAVGIAKSRVIGNVRGTAVERSEERFFRPGRKNPVTLRQGSAALFLLERLRDEAHRFAVSHHRRVHAKTQLDSALDAIPGVGPQRRRLLLRHFGSVGRLRTATLGELEKVPGLPRSLADTIHRYFHPVPQ